ncbi:PREDICTED: uncharacterized protein LOC108560622 [Nicrophorus vespilloides]|uniref:Uncharacterized protein LOC108560622 n=1 Tax=Nicrophorus vespilloides TaxID=110193 RepID=A0ABM1MGN7_NICVS|nr:PREDICTED: uncharacterized protein LOC108560622 [Nicrophorus vespilloides]
MSTQDNSEFKFALRDIALHAPSLPNTYDRVRCSEWARKLAGMPDDDLESSKTRNEYIQFLRIQVRNNFLHGPFLYPPPENQPLSCLSEHLGNMLSKQIPYLPRTGPIAPMVHHRAPDGRAFISVKQIPGGGVLCYMAVSPDGFD